MITENRKFAVAILTTIILLAACSKPSLPPVVDVSPIGRGLEFLGIALVLATLIVVLSKFIGK